MSDCNASFYSESRPKLLTVNVDEAHVDNSSQLLLLSDITGNVVLGFWNGLVLSGIYIMTSIIFLISIRYSKNLEKQGLLLYDNTIIIMIIEFTKFFVSMILVYIENGQFLPYNILFGSNKKELWKISFPYMLPAFLYALYNNLTYLNLHYFDPGTVQLYMQSRILFTGFLCICVLKQSLSLQQWIGLFILTIGLFIKHFSSTIIFMNIYISLMFLQAFLSSLAGVYNELAFKRRVHISIHIQNFFIYLYGICFNFIFSIIFIKFQKNNNIKNYLLYNQVHIIFFPIILMGTLNGLTASLILKHINIIVKTFASAIEVILMTIVAFIVLGESLTRQDFIAGIFVMCSILLYYAKSFGNGKLEKTKV